MRLQIKRAKGEYKKKIEDGDGEDNGVEEKRSKYFSTYIKAINGG
jgi:hypothetical protein